MGYWSRKYDNLVFKFLIIRSLMECLIIHSEVCAIHFRNLVLFREKIFQRDSRDHQYFIEVALCLMKIVVI